MIAWRVPLCCLFLIPGLLSQLSAEAVRIQTNYYTTYNPHDRPYDSFLEAIPGANDLKSLKQAQELLRTTAKILPSVSQGSQVSETSLKGRITSALKLDWFLERIQESPVSVELIGETLLDEYVQQDYKITHKLLGSFPVMLLLPERTSGKSPAILGLHGHGGSMEDFRDILMGAELARAGYVVLIPRFRAMYNLYEREIARDLISRGHYLMSLRVLEMIIVTGALEAHPQVDSQKIGILAHSGGSSVAHLLARIHPVYSACVSDYDSSYHFPWEEICCETVPALARLSREINNRFRFPFPALKVPYHFSPSQGSILQFFRTHLGPGSPIKSHQNRELINHDLVFKFIQASRLSAKKESTRQMLSVVKSALDQVHKQRFDSKVDQSLSSLVSTLLHLKQPLLALSTAKLMRLPEVRLMEITSLLSRLKPKSDRSIIEDGFSFIEVELSRFDSKINSNRIAAKICSRLSKNGKHGLALILFKTLSLSVPEMSRPSELRDNLEVLMEHLILSTEPHEEILSHLESFPIDFQISVLSRTGEKTLSARLRQSLRRKLAEPLSRKNLQPFYQALIPMLLSRVFPEYGDSDVEIDQRILRKIRNLKVSEAFELTSEFLNKEDWRGVEITLSKLEMVEDKIEILLEMISRASQKKAPRDLLELLEPLLARVENPATRAGHREEILNFLIEHSHRILASKVISLALKDIENIEAPFDRYAHVENLGELALQLGDKKALKILLRLTPPEYDQSKLKNALKFKNLPRNSQSRTEGETLSLLNSVQRALMQIANEPLDKLLALHSGLTKTLTQVMQAPGDNSQVELMVDLAKSYADRGFYSEALEYLNQCRRKILLYEEDKHEVFLELAGIYGTLQHEYGIHDSLQAYLDGLTESPPSTKWIEPFLRMLENINVTSHLPAGFLQALLRWLVKQTHFEQSNLSIICKSMEDRPIPRNVLKEFNSLCSP